MNFAVLTACGSATPLAPLQVVGTLSALIFALNFSLEMLVLNGVGRNHQFLLLGLLLILAGWSMFEVALLRKRRPDLALEPVQVLLGGQLLVECTRLFLVFSVAQGGVDRSYGVGLLELGQAIALLPIYVVMFLAVARGLIACHTAELDAAYRTIVEMEASALRLTDAIPVGTNVIEVTPEGRVSVVFASKRWLDMLGLERDAVLADHRLVFRRVHPDDAPGFLHRNRQAIATSTPFLWEGRIVVDGVVRWVSVESIPRRLANGNTLFEGVMIDVTEHKEAQAALSRAHAALTEVAVERSKSEERERLLQDMHDGFGSQLESARLMAEQGQLSAADLPAILNECMADLYLVADTLSHADNTLADALADLRFRSDRRIRDLGMALHWDVALEAMPALPQRTQLQILRIVQEALNNAVKHAGARNIRISARCDDHTLRVAVTDDGAGLPATLPAGRGLRNMQQRARVIGATLSLQPQTPGTRVEIALNIGASS